MDPRDAFTLPGAGTGFGEDPGGPIMSRTRRNVIEWFFGVDGG